jgi:hypothetical protein
MGLVYEDVARRGGYRNGEETRRWDVVIGIASGEEEAEEWAAIENMVEEEWEVLPFSTDFDRWRCR